MDPKRLRTFAAAAYVGLAPATLEKLRCISSSGPRFIKIGRAVIYDTRDLDAWLESQRRRSTSDQGSGE